LSAVTFVMGYVHLSFNGDVLTAITPPVVTAGGMSLFEGQPAYRDMLCDRITHVVHIASVIDGEHIRIVFDDDSSISVSLHQEDVQGASSEAALFTAGDHM